MTTYDSSSAEVGPRLRGARLARGLSLRSVAQALGVSASLVSQVETGKTQPSVSTLYALVNHLGISMDQVLRVSAPIPATTTSGRPMVPVEALDGAVQRAEDGPVLEMENGVRWQRLAASVGGPVDPLLVTYEPGASSSVENRLMRHSGVEYAYLLEGELTLQLDFDTYLLGPGDSLHFESVRPHIYSNRSRAVARGIWFVVGRRLQNSALPSPLGEEPSRPRYLSSAVDVLRALDELSG